MGASSILKGKRPPSYAASWFPVTSGLVQLQGSSSSMRVIL
ncbi:hypothetical protein [Azospirillum doebereinerae]